MTATEPDVPPVQELGRECRRLGELVAQRAEGQTAWEELTVEFFRDGPGKLPGMRGTIATKGLAQPYNCPPEALAVGASLALLGGKYSGWLSLAVRFRPDQLPIPVGLSIRPVQHE